MQWFTVLHVACDRVPRMIVKSLQNQQDPYDKMCHNVTQLSERDKRMSFTAPTYKETLATVSGCFGIRYDWEASADQKTRLPALWG